MTVDLTDSIAPQSDQLDAVDLLSGPRTFTITGVSRGNAEQPVQFTLAEFERVWRPSKGMRRVLVAAWGPDASTYTGRRVTLYCDPNVTFGKERTGGTRISHMSDLPDGKRLGVPLLISRGKSAMHTVEPLRDDAPKPARKPATVAPDIASITDVDQLRGMWQAADPNTRLVIEARVAELTTTPAPDPADDPDLWEQTAAAVDARDEGATA